MSERMESVRPDWTGLPHPSVHPFAVVDAYGGVITVRWGNGTTTALTYRTEQVAAKAARRWGGLVLTRLAITEVERGPELVT